MTDSIKIELWLGTINRHGGAHLATPLVPFGYFFSLPLSRTVVLSLLWAVMTDNYGKVFCAVDWWGCTALHC